MEAFLKFSVDGELADIEIAWWLQLRLSYWRRKIHQSSFIRLQNHIKEIGQNWERMLRNQTIRMAIDECHALFIVPLENPRIVCALLKLPQFGLHFVKQIGVIGV